MSIIVTVTGARYDIQHVEYVKYFLLITSFAEETRQLQSLRFGPGWWISERNAGRKVKLQATYERIATVTATHAVHREAKFCGALFPRISDQRSLSTTLPAFSCVPPRARVARLIRPRCVFFFFLFFLCGLIDGELNPRRMPR